MVLWRELLAAAEAGEHVVQLYGEDDQLLARNVSRYLAEGLSRGDGLVVIATESHAADIKRHLGELRADVHGIFPERQIIFLDARATLDEFTVEGELDEALFRGVIGGLVREARGRSRSGRVRAFGEMVALLWMEGRPDAAARLEGYWNRLLRDRSFSLYCAYPIDLFLPTAELDGLNAVLNAHTHLCSGAGRSWSGGRS
jgi:hypothetical protein